MPSEMNPRAEVRDLKGCGDLVGKVFLAALAGSLIAGALGLGLFWTGVILMALGTVGSIAVVVAAWIALAGRYPLEPDAAGDEDESVSDMVQDAIDTDAPSDAEVDCLRRNTLDLDAAQQLELDVRFAAAVALFHGPVPYIVAHDVPDIAEEA